MTRNVLAITALIAATLVAPPVAADERFALDVEIGPAWQLRNDFAVPGDSGTLVRLDDDSVSFSGRATLNWKLGDRWSMRFLAAPLSTDAEFVPDGDVLFQNAIFAAGKPVQVDYRFDSYRIGGVYRFPSTGPWSFRAGVTAKLRDAKISMRNDETSATKSNTGFVPLLYGGMRYEAGDRLAVDLDIDGAAASQGRAIDASIRVETRVTDRTSVYLGGRVLDGGADNEEVYSFATFAWFVAGAQLRW